MRHLIRKCSFFSVLEQEIKSGWWNPARRSHQALTYRDCASHLKRAQWLQSPLPSRRWLRDNCTLNRARMQHEIRLEITRVQITWSARDFQGMAAPPLTRSLATVLADLQKRQQSTNALSCLFKVYVIILLRSAPHLKGVCICDACRRKKFARRPLKIIARMVFSVSVCSWFPLFKSCAREHSCFYRAAFRQQKIHSVCFYLVPRGFLIMRRIFILWQK